MSLELLNSTFFVTIQDKGRFGYSHIGVTNSGAMDEYAYFIVNRLLKNSLDTNVLEIGCSNVIFKFHKNTKIALCGADSEIYLNNEKKELWKSFDVKKNDILKIEKILHGNWLYLGVFGGFNIKKEFDSNSVTIKENFGGLDGNILKKGVTLPFFKYKKFCNSFLKKEYIPNYKSELILRVIFSYQEKDFKKEEKEKFLNTDYFITKDFNRMAFKLKGEPIKCDKDGIISEGIAFGSIQIPKDGQPIILLKERQTIGGYPKIGVVLGIDCFKLSQAKFNTKIRFEEISYEEALKITRNFYLFFS